MTTDVEINLARFEATTEIAVTDPAGGITTYRYDVFGRIKEIVRPHEQNSNNVEQFYYDTSGNLVRHIESSGKIISMAYDGRGNLIRASTDLGPVVESTYNDQNKLLAEVTSSGGLKKGKQFVYDPSIQSRLRFSISEVGDVVEYRYDAFGRNTETISYQTRRAPSFNADGMVLIDALDMEAWAAGQASASLSKIEIAYDFRGQISSVTKYSSINPDGSGVVDGTESVQHYIYDARGQLLQAVDSAGRNSAFTYDGLGRILSAQNALGQLDLTSYDDANATTVVSNKNGLVNISAYDSHGRLISTRSELPSGAELGVSRSYYDSNGNMVMRTGASGEKYWSLYNTGGLKIGSVDPDGTLTEYSYDEFDRLIKTRVYAENVDVEKLIDGLGQPLNPMLDSIRPTSNQSDFTKWQVYDRGGVFVSKLIAWVGSLKQFTMNSIEP